MKRELLAAGLLSWTFAGLAGGVGDLVDVTRGSSSLTPGEA